jgi:hypothetical protein
MKLLLRGLVITPLILSLVGCESLPGTRKQQGTVIGGAAGAAAGAAVTQHHLLGALIGGALGAGGGYLVAANTGKINSQDQAGASQATRKAQENPATPDDARRAMTADLNNDGFVTLDEVVAMRQAGFSDQEMVRRLQATDQVFELTPDQQNYLRQRGVDDNVITQMSQMNRGMATPGQPAPVQATPPPANVNPVITSPPPTATQPPPVYNTPPPPAPTP